ncbi:MAG: hypothetical protein ACI3XR_06645 [Eubacteriales bacterium]
MKQTKKTRLLAGILAALVIVTPGTISSFGDESDTGNSGSSSSNGYETQTLAQLLATIDYSEYRARYVDVPSGSETVTLSGDLITGYDADITNATGVQKLSVEGGTDLLYLPADGIVGWEVQIPAEGMYNLKITYYPVYELDSSDGSEESKTTSIERTFYINEKLPFYEARFLTMTKSWSDVEESYQLDSNGNIIYKYMKDREVVYPYVDVDGNLLERTKDENKRLAFVKTGETVDESKIVGCLKYPVYKNDINGNEIKPDKSLILSTDQVFTVEALGYEIRLGEYSEYTAVDSTGQFVDPFCFYFTAGTNTIQLEAQRESMAIARIELVPVATAISYEEYCELHKDAPNYTGEGVKIQAEYPAATSENTVYATNDRTSYITEPQDPTQLILNAIGGDGGEKWKNVGQWVRWSVEVPETGWYQITLRFKQSVLEGTFSSRTLRIATASMIENGEPAQVPFSEAQYLQFNYSDDWQVAPLNNGTKTADGKGVVALNFYLEKGVNYIELEASLGNMADILRRVEASMNTVNSIYIKILMITGAEPDSNADYGFYRIMPDDIDELLHQAEELQDIADAFQQMMDTTGSHAKTLEKVALLLERMGSDEDKIASNLSNLKENLGTLGTWLQQSTEQPLEIDYIIVEAPGTDVKTHKANDNFLQALLFELVQFACSFVSDYNTLGSMEEVDSKNTVQVWTTLGRDQAMIIRNLINSDFNATHSGISIELKLVAGGSLLPSVLAGVGPDVSMGHGSGDVINWAIRSAVMPLNTKNEDGSYVMSGLEEVVGQFDETEGFLGGSFDAEGNFVGGYFTKAAIEPLELFGEYDDNGDGIADRSDVTLYGLPETQSFSMMFYRADVLQNLGLEPPKTWDDLIAMLPVFQNNHMEVALPNSLGGLNLFNYQMGGNLYSDNGKRISFEEDVTLTAFDYMCSFFTKYKCPYTYDFANRFRTGEIPLGIMDYTTYTQLSVYATEIRGLWEFVALPGVLQYDEEGNVTGMNNTSVSGVSAMIMLYDEDRTAEQTANAWEYMKWYVGEKNQSAYANELTALLGTVSKHNTANVNALASLSWTTSEYKNLMSQFNNLSAVREYPGGYIITRYTSFAFLAAYNNNADPTETLLSYVTEINNEITRKRKEFNMTYYSDASQYKSASTDDQASTD